MSSRPRGRPRRFDPADALAAAAERFRTRGYSATSLDELGQATGLGRPSLYGAFGDKRALYLAALRRAHDGQEAELVRLVEAGPPPRDALARLFARAIHGHLSGELGPSGCILTGTAPAEAVAEPEVRAALAAYFAMQDRLVADLLRACGVPLAETRARIVAAALHSLGLRARAGEGRDALERLARDCIALVAD